MQKCHNKVKAQKGLPTAAQNHSNQPQDHL